jgi:hypothetical protein
MILEPDYPHVVFAFPYRGVKVEITQCDQDGINLYSAWVDYPQGSAVAVPKAYSRNDAIRRARRWVDQAFSTTRDETK